MGCMCGRALGATAVAFVVLVASHLLATASSRYQLPVVWAPRYAGHWKIVQQIAVPVNASQQHVAACLRGRPTLAALLSVGPAASNSAAAVAFAAGTAETDDDDAKNGGVQCDILNHSLAPSTDGFSLQTAPCAFHGVCHGDAIAEGKFSFRVHGRYSDDLLQSQHLLEGGLIFGTAANARRVRRLLLSSTSDVAHAPFAKALPSVDEVYAELRRWVAPKSGPRVTFAAPSVRDTAFSFVHGSLALSDSQRANRQSALLESAKNISGALDRFWSAYRDAMHPLADLERRAAPTKPFSRAPSSAIASTVPSVAAAASTATTTRPHAAAAPMSRPSFFEDDGMASRCVVLGGGVAALGSRDKDAADDAADAGRENEAERLEMQWVVLCNATGPAAGSLLPPLPAGAPNSEGGEQAMLLVRPPRLSSEQPAADGAPNGTATTTPDPQRAALVATVVHLSAEPRVMHAMADGSYYVLLLFLTGILIIVPAISTVLAAARDSVAVQGRIAYGMMGHLLLAQFAAFGVINVLAAMWWTVSRAMTVVSALCYLSSCFCTVTVTFNVQRGHRTLGLRSFARYGVVPHCAAGAACAILLSLVDPLSMPVLLVGTSWLVPQIWHSVAEGVKPPMPFTTCVALSLGHTLLVMPFLIFDDDSSVFQLERRLTSAMVVAAWQVVQLAVIAFQLRVGPTRIVPRFLRPKRHEYSVQLKDVRGLVSAEDPDCTICRVELLDTEGGEQAEVWVTPCQHVFHRDCLERWMEERLECPLCRCKLPSPNDV